MSVNLPCESRLFDKKAISLNAFLTQVIFWCLLPLVLMALFLGYTHVTNLLEEREQEARDQVRNVATSIDRQLMAQIAALELLAASPLADDPARFKDLHKEAQGFIPSFGGHVILADMSMQMLFNTRVPFGRALPRLPKPKGHAAAPHVAKTGKASVGDMFFGPIAKKPLVAVVVPVIRNKQTRYLLLGIMDVSQYQRLIDEIALPEGWSLAVLDGKGAVMAQRPFLAEDDGRSGGGSSHRFVVNSSLSPWSVALSIPAGIYNAPIINAAAAVITVILAAILAGVLGGRLASRRLARSVATLGETPSSPSAQKGITEIEAVRRMLIDANQKRAQAEVRYRDLYEKTPSMLFSVDAATGTVIQCNQVAAQELGYSKEEIIGRPVLEIYHPDSREAAQRALKAFLSTGQVRDAELQLRRKDGDQIDVSLNVSAIRDQEGKILQSVSVCQDITAHKRAEKALRQSEALLKKSQETARLGSWVQDLPGNMTWSEEMYRLFQVSPQVFTPNIESFVCLVHPDDQTFLRTWLAACMDKGNHGELEFRAILPNGTVRYMSGRCEQIRDGEGNPVQVSGTVQDITERKIAEEALRQSNEHFRAICASTPDHIIVQDEQLRYTFVVNPQLGLTEMHMMGKTDHDFLAREDADKLTEIKTRVLRTGEPFHLETSLVSTSGQTEYFNGTYVPRFDAQGNSLGVIGYFRNVTEQKRSEEEIRARNLELAAITDILEQLSANLNLQTRLELGLKGATALAGVEGGTLCLLDQENEILMLAASQNASPEMLQGLRSRKIKIGDCLCGRAAQTGEPLILWDNALGSEYATLEAVCNEGIRFHAAFPLQVQDRTIGVLCIFSRNEGKPSKRSLSMIEDLCGTIAMAIENARLYQEAKAYAATLERRVAKRTKELAAAKERAESADRLKSAFLATMSHELRTPLNSIIGFTGTLLQGLGGPLNDEQIKQMQMVQGSGRHLLTLINDILDISKIEAGQLEIHRESFNLPEAVSRVVESIAPQAQKKGVIMEASISQEAGDIISDKRRVEQILLNLLNNAVKFTPSGGRVKVTVDPWYGQDAKDPSSTTVLSGWLRLSVEDTGIGIKKEDMGKLFQPFRQIDTGLTRQYEGSGLGLSICQRLVEMLGGEIRAESQGEGKGSQFLVILPTNLQQ